MAISNIGNLLSQQYMLSALRDKVNEANRLATTGKKSTTLAGMGPSGASKSIALRNQYNLFDTYVNNLSTAKSRFQIMDNAFLSVTDSARDMASSMRSLLQGGDVKAQLMSDKAQTLLNSVVEKMNVQYDGRYLFSGDSLYSVPVNNAGALDANMAGLVAGWMAGTPTSASVMADATAVTGANLGINNDTINAGGVTVRVDDRTDIDMTAKADQSGFADVMRGLSIIANLPQPTTQAETENYWAIVNGAIALLDRGSKALDETQGLMGTRAGYVESLISQHKETQGDYEMFIGDVEDIDMAEASLRLDALMTQMQASMKVISETRNLSLVNYL